MTVSAIIAGLLPIMWSQGAGSEVMRRIAAPMIGGMVSSTLLTLIVIPVLYMLVKQWEDISISDVPLMGKSNFLKDNK
jgi:Cu(I)/Ag(I) efflux system membrane protein CusA/SilA